MRSAFHLSPRKRFWLGLGAAVPAALLVLYGVTFSAFGETAVHRAVEHFWHGSFGGVLDVLWHPAVVIGGLIVALMLNLALSFRSVSSRAGVHETLGSRWCARPLNLALVLLTALLTAILFLYLVAENAST